MIKEFVPYEQALSLKELGFDGECLGYFEGKNIEFACDDSSSPGLVFLKNSNNNLVAILYQQAFRWFRENHKLQCYPILDIEDTYWCLFSDGIGSGYLMKKGNFGYYSEDHLEFKTYEEAELECLKKLIEITKK